MDEQEKKLKLLNYVKALVQVEQELRAKHNIGDSYRSIANRFKSLLNYIEENADVSEADLAELASQHGAVQEDEQYVYVYLFNMQGRILSRWISMLSPRSLAEYSVNRPVYEEEQEVEAYIRSRPNDDAHAYLVMKVNKTDVMHYQDQSNHRDSTGQPLLKLKERSLKPENLVAFVYKGDRYKLINGQLMLEAR